MLSASRVSSSFAAESGKGEAVNAPGDADALLLAFVRERDVSCPRCGQNVRNLVKPVCPECGEALAITVGRREVRIAWLVLALAPSIFSGLAVAAFFAADVVLSFPPLASRGWLTAGFLACSGVVGLCMARFGGRFTRLEPGIQRTIVLATWSVHGAAFALVVWNR